MTFMSSPVLANEDSLSTPAITEAFLPIGNQRPGTQMKPEFVTIHNTANPREGADARMHSKYLLSGRKYDVSWHFTVDDHQIINHIPSNEIAWHAGDWMGDGNTKSIGIEICENEGSDYRKAEESAETLAAMLLSEYELSIDRLVMHQHWTGKHCPHLLLDKEKGSVGWDQFVQNVDQKLKQFNQQKKKIESNTMVNLINPEKIDEKKDQKTIEANEESSTVSQQLIAIMSEPPVKSDETSKTSITSQDLVSLIKDAHK
ncbi:peptidoglycan recognition protein family protein [Ileibacterium valens]|uniref:peptidoglycan recognition protein family protein n=1 Tax=Ileibacterium valens TaxID=1862668 RepID=UPI00256FEEBD|nr:N-acetylmuramoyl-L-alanine amidase [Ileibacterium valens]